MILLILRMCTVLFLNTRNLQKNRFFFSQFFKVFFCFVFPICTGITGILLLSWVIFLVKDSGLHV